MPVSENRLICPACDRTLRPVTIDSVTVDVCHGGCGGVWFDNLELDRFDEPREAAGEALLDVPCEPGLNIDNVRKRHCPRCSGASMRRFFFSMRREVEVDECPSCAGVWLDTGELRAIRAQFPSAEQREQAADDYVRQVIGEQLDSDCANTRVRLERAARIAHAMRFLCPSVMLPLVPSDD